MQMRRSLTTTEPNGIVEYKRPEKKHWTGRTKTGKVYSLRLNTICPEKGAMCKISQLKYLKKKNETKHPPQKIIINNLSEINVFGFWFLLQMRETRRMHEQAQSSTKSGNLSIIKTRKHVYWVLSVELAGKLSIMETMNMYTEHFCQTDPVDTAKVGRGGCKHYRLLSM